MKPMHIFNYMQNMINFNNKYQSSTHTHPYCIKNVHPVGVFSYSLIPCRHVTSPVMSVLYNRLAAFHKFHALNKASKDKVITESTSDVQTSAPITRQKAVMRALSIIECPTGPHLFSVLTR